MLKLFVTLLFQISITCIIGQPTTSDDSLVYKTLLQEVLKDAILSEIVIIEDTKKEEIFQFQIDSRDQTGQKNPHYDSVIFQHILKFQSLPERKVKLARFEAPIKISWYTEIELQEFKGSTTDDFWDNFHRKHKGAYAVLRFSTVYYSPDKKTAILTYSSSRNSLNAIGELVVIRKIDGKWQIAFRKELWAS